MKRILAGLALAAATIAAGCDSQPRTPFNGVDVTGSDMGRELHLLDFNGKPRSLEEFRGKVVLVTFGYTQCPDVCPTTMLELAQVKKELGADGARVQGVFVSVDPERDTPEILKAYVGNFGPDFVALRGTPEETKAAAKAFKVFYSKVPGKTETSYTIDHTAGEYVFDTRGRVRLFTRYGSGAEALKNDLKILLAEPNT